MGSALGQTCPLCQREKGYAGILRVPDNLMEQVQGHRGGSQVWVDSWVWPYLDLQSPTLKATETLCSPGFMCGFYAGLKLQLEL